MHGNQTIPRSVDKCVSHLEHFIQIAQDIKDEFGKPEMGIDQGVLERKRQLFDLPEGEFRSRDVLCPFVSVPRDVQKLFDRVGLFEDCMEGVPVEQSARFRRRRDCFRFGCC